jgi:hypothetical protein
MGSSWRELILSRKTCKDANIIVSNIDNVFTLKEQRKPPCKVEKTHTPKPEEQEGMRRHVNKASRG